MWRCHSWWHCQGGFQIRSRSLIGPEQLWPIEVQVWYNETGTEFENLISDDFTYSGTYSLTSNTANGYPIWSYAHPDGYNLYIYLHDNGYIHVYHESSVGFFTLMYSENRFLSYQFRGDFQEATPNKWQSRIKWSRCCYLETKSWSQFVSIWSNSSIRMVGWRISSSRWNTSLDETNKESFHNDAQISLSDWWKQASLKTFLAKRRQQQLQRNQLQLRQQQHHQQQRKQLRQQHVRFSFD